MHSASGRQGTDRRHGVALPVDRRRGPGQPAPQSGARLAHRQVLGGDCARQRAAQSGRTAPACERADWRVEEAVRRLDAAGAGVSGAVAPGPGFGQAHRAQVLPA